MSLQLGLCLTTGVFVVLGIESKLRRSSEKTGLAIIGLCNFLLTASIHFLCAALSIWSQTPPEHAPQTCSRKGRGGQCGNSEGFHAAYEFRVKGSICTVLTIQWWLRRRKLYSCGFADLAGTVRMESGVSTGGQREPAVLWGFMRIFPHPR